MSAPPPPARLFVAPLLESRLICGCLCGAAVAHMAAISFGMPGWPCPIRSAFGIPCPGCGLGRAAVLLLRGEFSESLRMHAFAAPFVVAMILLLLAASAPARPRVALLAGIARCERAAPFAPVIPGGLVIYWLLRFVLDAPAFVHLVT